MTTTLTEYLREMQTKGFEYVPGELITIERLLELFGKELALDIVMYYTHREPQTAGEATAAAFGSAEWYAEVPEKEFDTDKRPEVGF